MPFKTPCRLNNVKRKCFKTLGDTSKTLVTIDLSGGTAKPCQMTLHEIRTGRGCGAFWLCHRSRIGVGAQNSRIQWTFGHVPPVQHGVRNLGFYTAD